MATQRTWGCIAADIGRELAREVDGAADVGGGPPHHLREQP